MNLNGLIVVFPFIMHKPLHLGAFLNFMLKLIFDLFSKHFSSPKTSDFVDNN